MGAREGRRNKKKSDAVKHSAGCVIRLRKVICTSARSMFYYNYILYNVQNWSSY